MSLQFCLKLYNQTSETIPKKLFLNSKIIWICIYSLNITMYLIWFSSFEETQRKSIVLLWDESTWLMRIIVGWKYGKIEGRELTVCTLYYILIYPLVKRYTYTWFLARAFFEVWQKYTWTKSAALKSLVTKNTWVKEFLHLYSENRISWIFGLFFENAHEWNSTEIRRRQGPGIFPAVCAFWFLEKTMLC